MKRILIGGIGHDHLRDLSAGRILVERLRGGAWPPGVQVVDVSVGAVALHYWLEENPFDAAVFVVAEPRGRPPGSIHRYTWSAASLDTDAVQSHVADALMGVVSLETLLVVAGHLGELPPHVRIVEVEPRDQEWGTELSAPVAAALDEVEAAIRQEVEALL